MFALALLPVATAQCTNDEVVDIIRSYWDLDACLLNNCEPEEEEAERRRPEDDAELPEDMYTTFSCYCNDCLELMEAQMEACLSCPVMTYVYDEEYDPWYPDENEDYDEDDDGENDINLNEFTYAGYCIVDGFIVLEKANNFCSMMNDVSESCLSGSEALKNEEEEEEEGGGEEGEEQINYMEVLMECWTSPFQQSSNTMMSTCGEVCDHYEAQTCGVEMLSDAENVPNGVGAYGVGCFDQSCNEDEAGIMVTVLKDMYEYAQFLTNIEIEEERQDQDEDATDGLTLPEINEYSWICNGEGGEGSSKEEENDWNIFITETKNVMAVVFGILLLVTLGLCLFYYNKAKTLEGAALCPPWSQPQHQQLKTGADYGSSKASAGVKA